MALASAVHETNQAEYRIPRFREINARAFKVFYDVDLDEFTVLFYGTNRRYAHRQHGPYTYKLVDLQTGELVGVEFHQFMKKVIPHRPALLDMLSLATVISEEDGPEQQDIQPIGVVSRIFTGWERIASPRWVRVRELLAALRAMNSAWMSQQPR